MLFNSFEFALFFPFVTLIYFLLPQRHKNTFLLIASCYFYACFIPKYLLILWALIIVDYFAALFLEDAPEKRRKPVLCISLASNIVALAIFKYGGFLQQQALELAKLFHGNYPLRVFQFLLPVGLSFHTFQSMGYTIDVYRRKQLAERRLGVFALYVMFYPQLVAGPIERAGHLLPQFDEPHRFDYRRVADGLKLMAWGFFQKIVIADRLAIIVNRVYAQPREVNGLALIAATLCFAFQIYCDFAGYSDVALGTAQVMGFSLTRNFNRPYFAASIGEFWRRWHISLSSWFRDYVYIPMGGNRVSRTKWWRNILVTFLLSGMWHGANWTFVVWGLYHGALLILSDLTRPARDFFSGACGLKRWAGLHRAVQTSATFFLVCIGWVFFRAETLPDAFYILTHFGKGWLDNSFFDLLREPSAVFGVNRREFAVVWCFVALLFLMHWLQRSGSVRSRLASQPWWLRWAAYYAAVACVVFFGAYKGSKFIYFQF